MIWTREVWPSPSNLWVWGMSTFSSYVLEMELSASADLKLQGSSDLLPQPLKQSYTSFNELKTAFGV